MFECVARSSDGNVTCSAALAAASAESKREGAGAYGYGETSVPTAAANRLGQNRVRVIAACRDVTCFRFEETKKQSLRLQRSLKAEEMPIRVP